MAGINETVAAWAVERGEMAAARLPDGIDGASLRQFDTAFGALSVAFHSTYIVEGVPLRQYLTNKQASDLARSLSGGESLAAVTAKVAAAYDYDCEEAPDHTFLVRKRYTDQNDLPCVTFDEMVGSLRAILDLLDPGPRRQFVMGKDSVFWTFYESLRPDQIARGRTGLSMTDFTPEQRDLASSAAREALIRRRSMFLWAVLRQLEHLRARGSEFTWMNLVGGNAFGFQGYYRTDARIGQFPLNNGFTCSSTGAYLRTVLRPHIADAGVTAGVPNGTGNVATSPAAAADMPLDLTAATDLDRRLAPGMLCERLPSTLTLAELSARCSATANQKTGDALTAADARMTVASATVDSALADKPVCLYGAAFCAPGKILRAAASLYGLRILDDERSNYRIAMPRARALDRAEDLGPEVARLMPAPFMRYWDTQTAKLVHAGSADATSGRNAGSLASARQDAIYGGEKACYMPVVRRLLVLALPLVPTSASPPVPIASAPPEVLRLISLLMMTGDPMNELSHLRTISMPKCLTDPDSMSLQMRMIVPPGMGGQQLVEYIFGYKDGSGKFVNEGGGGTSRKPPVPANNSSAPPSTQ